MPTAAGVAAAMESDCPSCHRRLFADDLFCASCGAQVAGTGDPPAPARDRLLEKLRGATTGQFDVHGQLGRGGMAAVYLADDLTLGRQVAIKVMLPELLLSDGMAQRFLLEARVAARLAHPNIVVIHGVAHTEELYYFTMSLVEGTTLEDVMRKQPVMETSEACWIVAQAARALHHAHDKGVVHRDVKPANILVSTTGDVVLSDFGIAKATQETTLTLTGSAIGTPNYMSPEQVLAKTITGAADQYSLGVVAYEMLSGHPPFHGSALEVQWAHAHTPPRPLREVAPAVPAPLADIIMRMLAKAPEDRWPSLEPVVEEFTRAMDAGAARSSLAHRASALHAVRVEERERRRAQEREREQEHERALEQELERELERAHTQAERAAPTPARRTRLAMLAGSVAVAGVAGMVWWNSDSMSTAAPAVATVADSAAIAPDSIRSPGATPGDARSTVVPAAPAATAPAPVATSRAQSSADSIDRSSDASSAAPALATAPMRPESDAPVTPLPNPPSAVSAPPISPPPTAAVAETPRTDAELRAELEATIDTYVRAFESGDLARIRAAYPSISDERLRELQEFFAYARNVDIRVRRIDVTDALSATVGSEARARVDLTLQFQNVRSRQDRPVPDTWQVVLRRTVRGWQLADLR